MGLADWIKQQGRALGFDRVGIAPAADLPELTYFPDWLERGYVGQMDYLHNPKRRDVRELMPNARSVVCCALLYDTDRPRSTELPADPDRGWVSRYAWGDDYHTIVREKLEALRAALAEKAGPGFDSRAYVDTGPVLERVYAHHAGLGWLAKNTCLLDADLGSFFFLGVLITNLKLAVDTPPADACGACTLCLEACPTGALVEPYVLDARRCISYLTIELRDAIPEELRPGIGRHLFGCDICQDVCPYNQRSPRTTAPAFHPRTFAHISVPQLSPAAPAAGPEESGEGLVYPEQGRRAPSRGSSWWDRHSCLSADLSRAESREPGSASSPSQSGSGDESRSPDSSSAFPTPPSHHHEGDLAPNTPSPEAPASGNLSFFHPGLDCLASLSEDDFRQAFKGSPIKRAKRRGLLRNTLVAMGNSGNPSFRPTLEKFAASHDPLLADHARWALDRLR